MKCLCGSGKYDKNCHGKNISIDKLRSIIKYDILKIDPGNEILINTNIKPLGFGKRTTRCILKYWMAVTPAGAIIYPLFIIKGSKALRPITLDGLHFDNQNGEIIQYVQCMVTPVSRGVVTFRNSDIQFKRNGYIECPCILECDGDPFQSLFAMDFKDGKIKLFHHTTEKNAQLIRESSKLIRSRWNLQGLEELTAHHYIYFTDLKKIQDVFDLIQIGMADKGTTIKLCTDDGAQIENFEVYRDETGNRTKTISVWVNTEIISPPPLILHEPNTINGNVYSWWEIFHCSIFRVPIKLDSWLPITNINDDEFVLDENENLLKLEGFNAGHGMDMTSMKRILTEPTPENHPRKDNLSNADVGDLDEKWVKTWSKNLSVIAASILQNSFEN